MNNRRISNIVIVGGGSSGWMSAAAMANAFGKTKNIVLIEADDIAPVGVGEATIPAVRAFNRLLGIDEREFMRVTRGTFKLGIQFENWGAIGESYVHPFGLVGKDSWMANFHHFWLKAQRANIGKEYWDYSLNIRAAKENKFTLDLPAGLEYAYHFDAVGYALFLRHYAEALGVTRQVGTVNSVRLNSEDGCIDSLDLNTGENITGDLFIDCSGFKAVLTEKALQTEFEDWSHWLPCNRAVVVQTELQVPPAPYTRSIAHECGWQWMIPLQHRAGNGFVYCSQYCDDETAKYKLLNNVSGNALTDPKLIRFKTGRREQQWNKNCVAIGLSSGFLEPLESTSLHLAQTAITRLIKMFPEQGIHQSVINEYNRQSKFEYDRIRDFIILHYAVTKRDDSDFWRYCRSMSLPDSLAEKIDIYKNTASVYRDNDELFHEASWQQVMFGQGITPQSVHPVVDKLTPVELMNLLKKIDAGVTQKLAQYPSHHVFIERYCKASETFSSAMR